VGILAALLVALCAWFMELNFLQPTGFVYLLGLAAYTSCLRGLEPDGPWRAWLWCGICVGIAVQFKAVAAFYGFAALVSLLVWRTRGRAAAMSALVLGAAAPTLACAAYFAATDRLSSHLEWTYVFPLFHYPPNTYFVSKIYTKLLFFTVFVPATLIVSQRKENRGQVWGAPAMRVAFVFGAVSLLATLKTQASHYFFPGVTFLCFVSARVLALSIERAGARAARFMLVTGTGMALLLLASVAAYRPAALTSLLHWREDTDDAAVRAYVQNRVSAQQRLIAIQTSTWVYWVSGRYPNIPLLNMDVQSTQYLAMHPGLLVTALEDPRLSMVVVDPADLAVEDPLLLEHPAARTQFESLQSTLSRNFEAQDDGPAGLLPWLRR
jgi:hypothetical protein